MNKLIRRQAIQYNMSKDFNNYFIKEDILMINKNTESHTTSLVIGKKEN